VYFGTLNVFKIDFDIKEEEEEGIKSADSRAVQSSKRRRGEARRSEARSRI
jgi:hypothetical protein